jgi:pimeloyl-ACP methyl ester carboxylesterase
MLKLGAPKLKVAAIWARDDLPGAETKLVTHWQKQGLEPKLFSRSLSGKVLTDDAYKGITPFEIWGEMCSHLVDQYPKELASNVPKWAPLEELSRELRTVAHFPWEGAHVRETLLTVAGLPAVLCEPVTAGDTAFQERPLIVFPNVGANRRTGTHRVYVRLHRRLAAAGYSVLRFDIPGLGDAPMNSNDTERVVFSQEGLENVHAVVTEVALWPQFKGVVLSGICSGAHNSFHTAVDHPAVRGVMLLNINVFEWKDGDSLEIRQRHTFKSNQFYASKVLDKETILRVIRRDVNVRGITRAIVGRYLRSFVMCLRVLAEKLGIVERNKIEQGYRKMLERNVQVLNYFSSEDSGVDVLAGYVGAEARKIRRFPNYEYDTIQNADHTFTGVVAQTKLAARILDFLKRFDGK